jgi:hypothetical protein
VTAIEFLNFGAMLIMWLIVLRFVQIVGRDTWLAPALGALHQ